MEVSNRKGKIIEIFKNLLFSFLAYAFPTAVLQFVIQPIIANILGAEINGQYLTLMSLNFFIIGVSASVLNTVRMLQHAEYNQRGIKGDFNLFFLIYGTALVVIMPVGFILYTGSTDIIDILLYLLIGLLYLYHDYIFVQYRIEQKFNKILINNIILVVGYFIGVILFKITLKWQFVVITAYLLGAVYDFFNTDYIKEPLKRTVLFGETAKKIGLLSVSGLLSSAITYCDKLLLYPLLGGTDVSIYNTAAIVGKILIMISSPMNSVMLSYLIKIEKFKYKIPRKIIFYGIGIVVFLYTACVLIGYPLVDFLYPAWADQSKSYIPITVAASVLSFISSLLNTLVIRFYKTSFQVYFQGLSLVLYLMLSLTFLSLWSLIGFCYGVALANLLKVCFLIVLILVKIKKEQ